MVIAGLALLALAGDLLVKGAVNLSLRLGIPALIVSLTIVAFGTSAPELLIAVDAVLNQAPAIAIGNVIGSNIANVLLVLGLPALFASLPHPTDHTADSYVMMLGASLVFTVALFLGPLTWVHGLVFIVVLISILGHQIRVARTHMADTVVEGADAKISRRKIAIFIAVGLVGLPVGADLLVKGSVQIARTYGVSEGVIGLTLVAAGTSLPELATAIVAAIRRHGDVLIGNVIGSNVFNVLAIPGVAALVGTMPVDGEFLRFDIWIMLATSLLLAPVVFGAYGMSRLFGMALTGLYGAYVLFQFL